MASGKILTVPFALWAGKKVLALWWVWIGGHVRVIRHKVVWPRANESTKLVHLTKVEDWDVAINKANGVHYLTASVDTLSSHTTYVTLIAKCLLCQFSGGPADSKSTTPDHKHVLVSCMSFSVSISPCTDVPTTINATQCFATLSINTLLNLTERVLSSPAIIGNWILWKMAENVLQKWFA